MRNDPWPIWPPLDNLRNVVAEIERRYVCFDGPESALAPTREPYVVIGIQDGPTVLADGSNLIQPGIVEPRQRQRTALTSQEAIENFILAFSAYAFGRDGSLYWRARPELLADDGGAEAEGQRVAKRKVYCRLLISSSPVFVEPNDGVAHIPVTA